MAAASKEKMSLGAKLWLGYLVALQMRPVLTKAVTQLVLSAGQEVSAQSIVGVKKYDFGRVFMLSAYGFAISAPLSHYLFELMNRVLAGTTSTVARLAWSNLVTLPIQVFVFAFFMTLMEGKTPEQALKGAQARTLPVLQKFWRVYPPVQFLVYRYLPQHLWLPFFQLFGFVMGTYMNVLTRRAAAPAPSRS